ncbi:molybdenum cofactor guanylyltransferase MobA [Desertibaculum subflavum]|uniref:molybdenum cofactor guanylyltransferase MobA n=1 Tax=Desertibaculum subflavum TaxID=2268458 RepID=UPI000E66B92F
MPSPDAAPIPAVILAGGEGRRLGGVDKAFVPLGGRALIEQVVARLAHQVAAIAISANGDPERFARLGLPVLPDPVAGRPGERRGPLAGLLAGLDWAAADWPEARRLLTVPVDCPFLPTDLAARLAAAGGAGEVVLAASGGRRHPVAALWPVGLAASLRTGLGDGSLRKVEAFALAQPHKAVEWSTAPFDPFLNINTAEDLAAATALLGAPLGR